MCLYLWNYTINHNENEDENEKGSRCRWDKLVFMWNRVLPRKVQFLFFGSFLLVQTIFS